MKQQSDIYNATFIETLYETYLVNPMDVSAEWRSYFEQLEQKKPTVVKNPSLTKQSAVLQLIHAYRFRAHQRANVDPLNLYTAAYIEELYPEYYGFTQADMQTVFNVGSFYGLEKAKLYDIITRLESIYCGAIGAEYMHITDTKQKRWIQQRLEGSFAKADFSVEKKLHILKALSAAQGLEEFLHTKYVGQKRFSLEGAESLIPLLDQFIQDAGSLGVKEVVLGMAHRGRLNVLVNLLGKRTKDLFAEFEGKVDNQQLGSGDVKYHLGYSSDIMTSGGLVHLVMGFNPSHLEIINPVIEGSVRARQERRGDTERNMVLPLLIHGDAAFAGQGVIMETLNLSQTHGYGTGGTVHIIINNQIGFTTSEPFDSRSTLYCTDVAKMVQAPIFHVNADDPEAVLFITKLALDYRMQFNKDVVIDLVCYRRQGHNEADNPFVTQPMMYKKIAEHPTTQSIYAESLVELGIIDADEAEALLQQYRADLKTKDIVSIAEHHDFKEAIDWKQYIGTDWDAKTDTRISLEQLQSLISKFTTIPEGFELNHVVAKLMTTRKQILDWGCAETLAYASLLEDGYPIRLSGQDSARGTFAHRHAVLHDQNSGDTYIPLQNISETQANFLVINSLLSEQAVLGFEYGYSSSNPETLVIWEAQFGDFVNNAQVVIDQFLSSSEAKWQRYCGLVLFLPHGYDGQGPEHSSARLERFLWLCAEDNIQVCIPTTPAQFFHLLRRQMLRNYRKPLIIMTPKSLLRHKLAISQFHEFTEQGFQTVIDDIVEPTEIKRLLFCSGKVYYDLLAARQQHQLKHIGIIRLEQLYPFPEQAMATVLARYEHVKDRVWVQEEPRNQGAWEYIRAHHLNLGHSHALTYVGRAASASPAVGYLQIHRQQLQQLINEALDLK
ncbi:2-oxoglutarate dehydrogenase E1 component [Candidatus Marithrix sp. Canyon 246]|uniref:2-oxoglutarate dehydrogenase E1 component n=1 Tax=Candidatus Marithrix sp. Canyon 246 TaxID=1827136 RepID=UPI00084A0BE3|nr:2-oxoglutarate dehydrogenase E1 component [Candidatus Marithrix sp. Canyon 246]